ncbi:MAG: hypothetical protein M3O74_13865 [Pseudomonadota bacterium]|nr:hypothetical protein [Pseudomonadota bacterium]
MNDKKQGTWRVTQGNGRQYLVHTFAKAGVAQTCGYTVERLDEAPSAGEAERVQIADATSEIEAMARPHFERWTVWKLLPPVEPCPRFKGSYKDNLTAHLWVAYRDGYAQSSQSHMATCS